MPSEFKQKVASSYRRGRLYGLNYGTTALVKRALARPEARTIGDQAAEALWGGFSTVAQRELESVIASSTSSPAEQAKAAWELARWFAFGRKHEETLQALRRIPASGAPPRVSRGKLLLEVRTLQALGRTSEARRLAFDALDGSDFDADLCMIAANTLAEPAWAGEQIAAADSHLALVNRIFQRNGLLPLRRIDPGSGLSLENITAAALDGRRATSGPLVSVIMPAYNAAGTIGYAVRGLLEQTWRDLEVIIVDDASSDDTPSVAERAADGDERVSIVRLPRNGGSYVASNAGLERASGDYVTTHGADDWSHSEKIELQVAALPDAAFVATQTYLVRTTMDFRFTGSWRPSSTLLQPNASSLMLPAHLLRELGGWDPVRTSGDTEFMERLAARQGGPTTRRLLVDVPLSFALDAETTLTHRPDTHVRSMHFGMLQAYHAASRRWHTTGVDLRVENDPTGPRRFPAPAPMRSQRPNKAPSYDEVVVADFATGGSALDEAYRWLVQSVRMGRRIGIFHWPSYETVSHSLDERVCALLDAFDVEQLVPEQSVETTSLVIYTSTAMERLLDQAPAIAAGSVQLVSDNSTLGRNARSNLERLFGLSEKPLAETAPGRFQG